MLTLCLTEVKTEADLMPQGAQPGTVPTDMEQATGLERLEILGKMQGVDIFDMKPLDASRTGTKITLQHYENKSKEQAWLTSTPGTLQDPIVVRSFGDEQYVGCTGSPADSHVTIWLTVSFL